jgi:hypothetical protein
MAHDTRQMNFILASRSRQEQEQAARTFQRPRQYRTAYPFAERACGVSFSDSNLPGDVAGDFRGDLAGDVAGDFLGEHAGD